MQAVLLMHELPYVPLQQPAFRLPETMLCAASGGHLDAGAVLAALPGALPLGQAHATLAALLEGRQHAARQGAVVRSLRKAAHLAAASTRAEVQSGLTADPLHPSEQRRSFRASPLESGPAAAQPGRVWDCSIRIPQTDVCCVRATQLLGRRVAMSAERSCQACHNRIGNKMFAVYPSGVTVSWPPAAA